MFAAFLFRDYWFTAFYIRKRHVFTPYLMYEMHVMDIFAAFYIPEKIILVNIAKIKLLWIRDVLEYPNSNMFHSDSASSDFAYTSYFNFIFELFRWHCIDHLHCGGADHCSYPDYYRSIRFKVSKFLSEF